MDHYTLLPNIEDIYLNTAGIYSWHFTPELAFLSSNHPNAAPLKNIFILSSCKKFLLEHFQKTSSPIYLYDDFFFLWAAIPAFNNQQQLQFIHLLGPVFNTTVSDSYIKEKMDIQNMSIKSKKELLDLIDHIPVIPTFTLNHYICQMFYVLNNTLITSEMIEFQSEEKTAPLTGDESESPSHTPYFYETLLLKSISDGVPIHNLASILSTAQIGMMCPGDPLRQKKDEAISLITLFTRVGIQSGISPEKAYRMSDTYIQSVEAVTTIPEIIQFIVMMYLDITHQVHELSYTQSHTGLIRECISYLDLHFQEDVHLDKIAKELGYAKYYLSQSFKREMGISISQYLTQKRISYSKILLANPQISMQSISARLFFSNPSHFSSVFRRLEGMTPSQYRKKCIQ